MIIEIGEYMVRKKIIIQINACNFGSTGDIMLNISKIITENANISYVAYANSRTNRKKKVENSILIGSIIERNLHLLLAYYTGLNGCFSKHSTIIFLKQLDKLKPDIIHLHNLHNCYINLEMLFSYIKIKRIPVIWTLHDCWAFTGQCPHFIVAACEKWKTGCFECPQYSQYPESRVDKTKKMYSLKKEWFTGVENLTIITPSQWLADRVAESFLGSYPIKVLSNGINLDIYKPTPSDFRERYGLMGKNVLLGVASIWNKSKGLDIFLELAKKLNNRYRIVLVGLSAKQLKYLADNITGLPLTNSPKVLAEIYSASDWFVNPSMQETMGLVTVEALACGTPAIVSSLSAVPEPINSSCGVVVGEYNVEAFYKAITKNGIEFSKEECVKSARRYEMNAMYREYIRIYNAIA